MGVQMPESVIAAFPATGKTHLFQTDPGSYVDSDSSAFSWITPGVRHPEWPDNYMAHIRGKLAFGKTVLVSTHTEVRSALREGNIPFTLAYPAIELRDEYIARMNERGSASKFVTFVAGQWDQLIASCMEQDGCDHIVLDSGEYLSDVIGGDMSGPHAAGMPLACPRPDRRGRCLSRKPTCSEIRTGVVFSATTKSGPRRVNVRPHGNRKVVLMQPDPTSPGVAIFEVTLRVQDKPTVNRRWNGDPMASDEAAQALNRAVDAFQASLRKDGFQGEMSYGVRATEHATDEAHEAHDA